MKTTLTILLAVSALQSTTRADERPGLVQRAMEASAAADAAYKNALKASRSLQNGSAYFLPRLRLKAGIRRADVQAAIAQTEAWKAEAELFDYEYKVIEMANRQIPRMISKARLESYRQRAELARLRFVIGDEIDLPEPLKK